MEKPDVQKKPIPMVRKDESGNTVTASVAWNQVAKFSQEGWVEGRALPKVRNPEADKKAFQQEFLIPYLEGRKESIGILRDGPVSFPDMVRLLTELFSPGSLFPSRIKVKQTKSGDGTRDEWFLVIDREGIKPLAAFACLLSARRFDKESGKDSDTEKRNRALRDKRNASIRKGDLSRAVHFEVRKEHFQKSEVQTRFIHDAYPILREHGHSVKPSQVDSVGKWSESERLSEGKAWQALQRLIELIYGESVPWDTVRKILERSAPPSLPGAMGEAFSTVETKKATQVRK